MNENQTCKVLEVYFLSPHRHPIGQEGAWQHAHKQPDSQTDQ